VGAFTSKKTQFNFRPWEAKSFIKSDDTDIVPHNLRIDRVKGKTVRLQPISYWIPDQVKMLSENKDLLSPLFVLRTINTYLYFKELKNNSLIITDIKAYKQILNKLFDQTSTKINVFTSRKISDLTINNLCHLDKVSFYSDLLLNKHHKHILQIKNLQDSNVFKELITKHTIFLTNPRLHSPLLSTFLYQNQDQLEFSSFGSFVSNIKKHEIPLTTFNVIRSFEGQFDLQFKNIITSLLDYNSYNSELTAAVLVIAPTYLQTNKNLNFIGKYKHISQDNFNLSSRSKQNGQFFLSSFIGLSTSKQYYHLLLPLNNKFDHYLDTKIHHKILQRLFQIFFIIKPSQKAGFTKIKITHIRKNALFK
jgi:hypothetical protein